VGISAGEAEVLAALGEHLTDAEIGARLFIWIRTVESLVSSLLRKLQAEDRRALAAVAQNLRADPAGASAGRITVAVALPWPLTPLVGRLAERAARSAALREHRLVTAVGPGGSVRRPALSVAADVGDAPRVHPDRQGPQAGLIDASTTRRPGMAGACPLRGRVDW
jgi:DNA-binding CsgD family transcriptional regulator